MEGIASRQKRLIQKFRLLSGVAESSLTSEPGPAGAVCLQPLSCYSNGLHK